MLGYPQFSFWISIAPDMIYLSQIVIPGKKNFPLVGAVLKSGNCLSSLDISLVVTLGPEYIVTHFKFEFFPCSLIMLCYYNLVWTNEIYLFFKLT